MKFSDRITKQTQLKFGGYNHTENANDGEIYDMQNISSDLYPLITQRKKRDSINKFWGYVYKSRKYWIGKTNEKNCIYIQDDNNKNYYQQIKAKDIIEISIKGELSEASGRYIVKGTDYSSSNKEFIEVIEDFAVECDQDVRPTINNNPIPINDEEISIRVIGKIKGEGTQATKINTVYNNTNNGNYATEESTINGSQITNIRKEITNTTLYHSEVVTKKYAITYEANYYDSSTKMITGYDATTGLITFNSSFINYSNTAVGTKMVLSNGAVLFITSRCSNTDRFIVATPNNYTYKENETVTIYFYRKNAIDYYNPSDTQTKYYYLTDYIDEKTTGEWDYHNGIYTQTTTTFYARVYRQETRTITTVYDFEDYYLTPMSVGVDDNFYFVDSQGAFYYKGVYRGIVSATQKSFAKIGSYIYMLPDNVYYDILSDKIVRNSTLWLDAYDWLATFTGNKIHTRLPLADMDFREKFKAGDVVNVYASTRMGSEYNFKNATIQSVDEDDIIFTENIITRDGHTYDENDNELNDEELYDISITKTAPNLKYICADSNRFWGCDDKTIYCTSFGNPLGWYEYSVSQAGNDADIAWSIEPFDSEGEFTGCCIYNDRPLFFKENKVYTVYGSKASGFQLSSDEIPGVAKGSSESLCNINSILYYHSPSGVMRYINNSASCISDEFGEDFSCAVGGSDGVHYYITMQSDNGYKTFNFDTKKRLWCVEDNNEVKRYINVDRGLFTHNFENDISCLNPNGVSYEFFNADEVTNENDFDSFIELGDFYMDTLDKKGLSKIFFRLLVEDNSNVEIYINYDSGEWLKVKDIVADKKKSITVPLIPKRCDHFRIKIKGYGKWVLYAMSYEYYVGSEI